MIEYTVQVDENATRWYLNGEFHREDGPAVEDADGYKSWYLNGELHREDGPAYEHADGYKEWWVNGEELSEDEFNARTTTKELTVGELEDLLGYKIKVVK